MDNMEFEQGEEVLVKKFLHTSVNSWAKGYYVKKDEVEGFHIVNMPFGNGNLLQWLTHEDHIKKINKLEKQD